MPTTRTILMMLLNRYSEPPGSPEHAGTIVEGVVLLWTQTVPACGQEAIGLLSHTFLEGHNEPSRNE